jgi:hypothetical protein
MTAKERENGLAELIRERVERVAGGRILDLDVVCVGGRVVLKGRSRTQYAKQIAQQAVLDLPGERPALANRIEVIRPSVPASSGSGPAQRMRC